MGSNHSYSEANYATVPLIAIFTLETRTRTNACQTSPPLQKHLTDPVDYQEVRATNQLVVVDFAENCQYQRVDAGLWSQADF